MGVDSGVFIRVAEPAALDGRGLMKVREGDTGLKRSAGCISNMMEGS